MTWVNCARPSERACVFTQYSSCSTSPCLQYLYLHSIPRTVAARLHGASESAGGGRRVRWGCQLQLTSGSAQKFVWGCMVDFQENSCSSGATRRHTDKCQYVVY
jgi:hypothetical protein